MGNGKAEPGTGPGPRTTGISALLEDLVSPDGPGTADAGAWRPSPGPGTVIGRFEVVREVGRGGFGVVYEALDRDLGRAVAFKLLQGSVQPTAREERLLREAEAAARLSHPNIVTLFDVGRCEYGPYLVLELLKGRTLAARLADGPVPLAEALRLTVEVARGLAHAHARGIVHRDLTPGNVFVCDDGQVKLLDLGMAQAFGRRKLDGGTPAYMAPEQWRGAPEDERTDVFALGVILYRMLSGELPFPDDGGRSASGGRAARPLDVPEVPELSGVVARMLAKDPVDRFRDAGEVVAALTPSLRTVESTDGGTAGPRPPLPNRRRGWIAAAIGVAVIALAATAWLLGTRLEPGAVRTAGAVPAVAVLPFADHSPGKDQGHFADGLAEEILNALAQVEGLRVAGRTSSFSFRAKGTPPAEIGRELRVDAVLDGSVRRSGSTIRVNAQLVSVRDGYQLWSQNFHREVTDVFAVQDEIARAVAQALRVKLAPGKAAGPERRTTVPEAYEKYLLGQQTYRTRGSSERFLKAASFYEKSIAADPGFAPAWAGLAYALAASADFAEGADAIAALKKRAIEAADKAVALGPDLPESYAARGFVRAGILWDWSGARSDFERALALNPRHPETLRRYGTWYLGATGRYAEGIAALRQTIDLDPLFVYAWSDLALLHLKAGDESAAGEALARALEIEPENVFALHRLAVKQLLAGMPGDALATARRNPAAFWGKVGSALALKDLGRDDESLAVLADLERIDGAAYQVAQVHAWRGDRAGALDWLEKAADVQDSGLPLDVKGDPLLRNVRGDPRYAAILARVNLPP